MNSHLCKVWIFESEKKSGKCDGSVKKFLRNFWDITEEGLKKCENNINKVSRNCESFENVLNKCQRILKTKCQEIMKCLKIVKEVSNNC